MRLKHLRELLKLTDEQMVANLVIPVERYRELEASQGDQHVSAFESDCEPQPSKEPDMFNTEPVLRRLLSTSNHAVRIQIEENEKLRKENMNLKKSIVRAQLLKVINQGFCKVGEIKLGQIDYMMLELSGVTRLEADKLAVDFLEKFQEDEE